MPDTKMAMPLLGSSPHITTPQDTRTIMGFVLISLIPASAAGIILYGIPALLTMLVSIAAAELGEFLFRIIIKQPPRNKDLSAAITGLLLALCLPPGTPLWMTALGAIFGIIMAKEFFGGLGANVFNPALIGRAFLLMSFPVALTTWTNPTLFGGSVSLSPADALTSATVADAVTGPTLMAALKFGGSLNSLGSDYSEMIRTLFLGNHSGSIGESSFLAILIGFVFLLIVRVIDWHTPVSMLATVFILSFILGRDPLVAILGGGVAFGAVFMATDYVTTPLSSIGKIIFGCGAGIIMVLIRQYGNYPEGVTFGILIMNAFTPFLNRLLPRKYGYVKPIKKKEKPNG
jgi:electron transport complex protein RnfD